MDCDGACGSIAVKLTVVLPSTGGAKLKPEERIPGEGTKLSLCWVSGKTNGTLWRWLHQVFMSTGVKKRPKAPWKTSPRDGTAWEIPRRGAKLCRFGYFSPSG